MCCRQNRSCTDLCGNGGHEAKVSPPGCRGLASRVIRGPCPDLSTQPQSSNSRQQQASHGAGDISQCEASKAKYWSTGWVHRHQRVSTSDRNTASRPDQTSQPRILICTAARPQRLRWTALSSFSLSQRLSKIPMFIHSVIFCAPLILSETLQYAETVFKAKQLTIGDLQQSLGDDTSGDVKCLAAVISHVGAFSIRDGQVPGLRHGKSTGGLRRLVGEQQVLWGIESDHMQTFIWREHANWEGSSFPFQTAICLQPSVSRYQLHGIKWTMSAKHLFKKLTHILSKSGVKSLLASLVYLTAFSLPEYGWLWVTSGLALEGDGSANPNHLVPWSHHKRRRHWRTTVRMVSRWLHKLSKLYYTLHSYTCSGLFEYKIKAECSCAACI